MSSKICTDCSIHKELSDFSKDRTVKGGVSHYCKACINAYHKEYRRTRTQKEKTLDDPLLKAQVKVRENARSLIKAIKAGKLHIKNTVLGCTAGEFKTHLESLFEPNMNWDNRGFGPDKWVNDHKTELHTAQTVEEVIKLGHYTNIQPRWYKDNIDKSNKIRYGRKEEK